jgi:hypothetical protein
MFMLLGLKMTKDYRAEFAEDFLVFDKRYSGVETFIEKMANGKFFSLIVNGPPGVGKTHSVDVYLKKYAKDNYKVISGHMTLLSLYSVLYGYRKKGQIVVLDDVDSVFSKVEGVNILKAAMDTKAVRNIHWESPSGLLNTMGLPKSFEFHGGVILISNIGFGGTNGKLVAHLLALKDRSYCIPIAESTENSLFKQICFMVLERGLMTSLEVPLEHQQMLLEYIEENQKHFHTLSLRTVVKLSKLFNLDPIDWRVMAEQTLMKA